MSRRFPALTLLLIMTLTGTSIAQLSSSARRTYTPDELVTWALTHNPVLRAARWDRVEADAEVQRAGAIPNPSVRLAWLHAQADPSEMGWGIGLRWTPPQPSAWSAQKASARARGAAVDADLVEAAADLAAAIQMASASADELAEQLRVASRAVEVRTSIEAMVKERLSQGASTRLDLGLASLSVARAEQERDTVSIERDAMLRRLAALAALPTGSPIELAPDTKWRDAALDAVALADAQNLALRRRAVLRADAARAEEARQSLRAEQARRWPWLSFSALPGYRYDGSASHRHDLSVGIDVTLPVLDGNEGKIAIANAQKGRQEAMRGAHEAAILRDVADAWTEVVQRRALLERFERTVEPMLRDHASVVEQALKGQQVDIAAVLNAEDLILRSQREYSDARLAFRKAQILLRRACGLATHTAR